VDGAAPHPERHRPAGTGLQGHPDGQRRHPMKRSGLRTDEVPTRVLDWGTIKWLVSPDLDPGAGLTTGEVVVYPGQGHAPHLHPDDQEVIYVISGEGVQTVGEDAPAFPIKAGDAVYIPANTMPS